MRVFQGAGCVLGGLLGLLGLSEELVVDLVERGADGSFTVHVVGVSAGGVCCPGCGAFSGRVEETVGQAVRHLLVAPVRVMWHKRRLACENAVCPRGGFVEDAPLAARGGRMSLAGLVTVGHLVGDWMVPVSRVAAVLGASWYTVHGGFVSVAETAGIVTAAQAAGPAERDDAPVGEAGGEYVEPAGQAEPPAGGPGRSVTDADRWQSVLIDSFGGHGLLGVVEGRAASPVAAWIAAWPAAWRGPPGGPGSRPSRSTCAPPTWSPLVMPCSTR